jgi:predicted anti-sigma-YlaC factor YlaD
MRRSGQTCERARAWASLRLDEELSELESALLDAHLEHCAACSDFAATAEGATLELRTASVERLEQPIALPSRRRGGTGRALQLGAAAALVAAAAGLGTVFGALGSGSHQPAFHFTTTPGLLANDPSPTGLATRPGAAQQQPATTIPGNVALPHV